MLATCAGRLRSVRFDGGWSRILPIRLIHDGMPPTGAGPRCPATMRVPAASTFQAVNWLEAAVLPDHGEEDLVHSLIVVWAIGQRDAAQIERADLLDGREQPRPRNRTFHPSQGFDDQSADHVSLERDEADLCIRIRCLERLLVPGHERDAHVPGEWYDLSHHHSFPVLAEFLCEGVGADE